MHSRATRAARAVAAIAATLVLLAATVGAGPFDKIKKKVEEKAGKKAEDAIDAPKPKSEEKPKGDSAGKGEGPAEAKPAAGGGALSAVSTKFDFVPGDSVILTDDFTQDDLGEFPAKWRLSSGTFEVAEMGGERWLRCTSDDGHIRMKTPPALPEFWTLEFDVYGTDTGAYLAVSGLAADGRTVWETMYPHGGKNFYLTCGDISSSTLLDVEPAGRRHTVMFMGRGTSMKAYIDRERLANVPDVSGAGIPAEFDFRLWAPGKPVKLMITNVRFAEGCRPAKDMLAEGKLVTYGIHFATGSDVVQPESAPVLRQIAAYMESKPDVKLKITGHTDDVGKPDANLDLSRRRAAAVARTLAADFKIAAERFATAGKGDTEPVSSNAKPEGRAMNRRVEFSKMEE